MIPYPSGYSYIGRNTVANPSYRGGVNLKSVVKAVSNGYSLGKKAVRAIASVTNKNSKNLSKVNKIINCETRFDSLSVTGTALASTSGTFHLLNDMKKGDSIGTREGNCIGLKSICISGQIETLSTGTNLANTVRVMLVYDKQTNGAIFSLADLLYLGGTAVQNVISCRNPNTMKRFTVLYDKKINVHSLPSTNATAGAGIIEQQRRNFKITRSWRQVKKTMYNDNDAGDITDIISGSLYLVLIPMVASVSNYRLHSLMVYEP